MDTADKIHTHYDVWRSRRTLSEDTIKGGFMAARRRLEDAGVVFDNPIAPEAVAPAAGVNYSSDEGDQQYDSSDEEDKPYEGPGGWPLVASFGWCLRSDGALTDATVQATLGRLGAGGPEALTAFLNAREAELAADPYLATKSRALRLQFAALGQEWFATLQGSPTLADYLQGETQAVDLEAALAW